MDEGTRVGLSIAFAVVGFGWWIGVGVWRGVSREHSARMFWLHLTSPLVGIALNPVAICLLLGSDRLWHRG
jgi:hypothetical protein